MASLDDRQNGLAASGDADAVEAGSEFHQKLLTVIWRWKSSKAATATVLIGLIFVGALTFTSLALYNRSETRLLKLRASELGLVLTAVTPSIQTPLASAAELADATGGSPKKFSVFMAPYVGPGREFASVSLWSVGNDQTPAPEVVIGPRPVLMSEPQRTRQVFAHAGRSQLLDVTGVFTPTASAIGYEFSTPGVAHGYAVYAETLLPKERYSPLANNTAGFSDLDYALYLGHSQAPANLLATSIKQLPAKGLHENDVVPFGDNAFSLVIAPKGPLSGAFFQILPWFIAGFGVVIVLSAGVMTESLARRREHAEELAASLDRVASDNKRMYAEQRGISETLQRALLPEALPEIESLETSALYVPASADVDIGGDWYDLIVVDEQRALLIVGDVSGHGIHAATTMAFLRHATLAYAAQGCAPASVLTKLSKLTTEGGREYFVTVLCVLIDVGLRQLTVASAGHPSPLLLSNGDGVFVEFEVGVPIGVKGPSQYQDLVVPVPSGATLIAFTDGLVERRGEAISDGLARLMEAAVGQHLGLDELLVKLARDLAPEGYQDDTAIVGIRWRS